MKHELQQERWSPIPSLRCRRRRKCPPVPSHCSEPQEDPPTYAACLETLDDDDPIQRLPSADMTGYLPFRMQAAVPQFTYSVDVGRAFRRPRLLCARRRAGPRRPGIDAFHRRQKMLRTLRKRTAELTKALPTFMQVNRIDRLSRVVFPSLFILFNAAYWYFYSVRR